MVVKLDTDQRPQPPFGHPGRKQRHRPGDGALLLQPAQPAGNGRGRKGNLRGKLLGRPVGVLTEINLKQTLKNKIDVDIDEQVILGACNPRFAHRGLGVEPSLGLLLPCNVVVRHSAGVTVVEAIDPEMMVEVTDNPKMEPLAQEVRQALKKALDIVAS